MKKSVLIIFASLLFIPTIFAVEVGMKNEFDSGETLIVKISGNFINSITKENIFLYRGHVRTAILPELVKIDDDFYIYFQLSGKNSGNYSFSIENAKYMKGTQISEEDIIKNFSINNQTADFSVNPGAVISDTDFSLELQNLQDKTITVKVNTETVSGDSKGFFSIFDGVNQVKKEELVSLKSGEFKKIYFNLNSINHSTFNKIYLSTNNTSYEIPVSITSNKSIINNNNYTNGSDDETLTNELKFRPSELDIVISTNSETKKIIYLSNIGEDNINNITIFLSNKLKQYSNISVKKINELKSNSSYKLELSFFSSGENKNVSGEIKAVYFIGTEENSVYLPVNLSILKGFISDSKINNKTSLIELTCSEINGIVCEDDESCDGDSELTKSVLCCTGKCKKESVSSTGKIIGWSIIIFIMLFLFWFFKVKYRGAKKEVNLLSKK
ncbi:MAG: hypothetical protein AABW81_01745 [Nanoarchaeota archaeon]